MVFNSLKRLFKPEYRIVFCRDCSTYHVQRRGLGGKWHYVTNDFFGIIATEFKYYSDAYMYVTKRHRLRKCRFSVLIHVNDCY